MNIQHQYDVVNDNDEPLYQVDDKKKLHQEGLLHRGVNVLFYTSKGEIILQKRSLTKNTFPGLLDITVGGHVEHGLTYLEAGLKEIQEETGLQLNPSDLEEVAKIRRSNFDEMTGTTSNYFCQIYAYRYDGNLEDLIIEEGKAEEFVVWKIDEILKLNDDERKLFTPGVVKKDYLNIIQKLQDRIKYDNIQNS